MNKLTYDKKNKYKVYDNGVQLIHFDILEKYNDKLIHCFTTRRGGVSGGECTSLNLGFNRNDTRENVMNNFKLVSEALNINYENLVLSNQIHDSSIKILSDADAGKGIIKSSDIIGYDGLITNVSNIAMVTFYADCIPVYIYDFKNNVIALLHSGWRSTYREISKKAIGIMRNQYQTNLDNISIVIGPSIGKCCFEIDKDVLDLFIQKFKVTNRRYEKISNNKYKMDLQGIIIDSLIKIGIKCDNIFNSNLCTKCNNDYFFSHRGDKGKTGSLCAIMQLR